MLNLTTGVPAFGQHASAQHLGQTPVSDLIDVIVPVHNSPEWVRLCLRSILNHSDLPYRLIVVDDASDGYTSELLKSLVSEHQSAILMVNETNLGFVKSCNLGMRAGTSSQLVLLNSDALVPPGWLSRLLACVEADPKIGIVNPLSNEAANLSIPLAPGCNYLGMDEWFVRSREPAYPDIVTAVGHCLMLRRQMLDQIGLFDEIFGMGYCEETDLCLRAMKTGWRVVACDNVYMFHCGSGSFVDRDQRYRHNLKIFLERHRPTYRQAYREFTRRAPLAELRRQVNELPLPRWRRWWASGRQIGADLAELHPLRAWRHLKEQQTVKQFHQSAERYRQLWRQQTPRVTFLFESLGAYGGVRSVLKLINGLIEKGFEVRVACLGSSQGGERGLYTHPLYFANVDSLVAGVGESDVFVSTFWSTAYWLAKLRQRFPAARQVSYLQDYESWFLRGSSDLFDKVAASYQIPDSIITTSDWLHDKLLAHGRESWVIPKGIDGDVFYPMDGEARDSFGVLAMTRPHTPYRGFANIAKIFAQLHRRATRVKLSVFGSSDRTLRGLNFPVRNYGVMDNPQMLARIYNRNAIYLDPSEFQGFGMMGLEAMACGTACVLTSVGGINHYAKDHGNALLFNPEQPEAATDMILELLNDESRRARLVGEGRQTAAAFSLQREIDALAEFFRRETDRSLTEMAAPASNGQTCGGRSV